MSFFFFDKISKLEYNYNILLRFTEFKLKDCHSIYIRNSIAIFIIYYIKAGETYLCTYYYSAS